MVIRKMNKIFARHGRLIFGLITVVIVVSFMGVFNRNGLGSILSGFGSGNAYGEIFGESVSHSETIEKANRDLIIGDLMFNAGLESHSDPQKMQINAFNSLSLLAASKRRGITVSNKEITEFITGRAKFKAPKTQLFDKELLSTYIDGELKSNGFSADELDLAVREHLINTKLLEELQDSVVVTQDEVKVFYRRANEKYYVSYALFDKTQYLKKIKVSEEEAKNYFKGYTPAKEDYIPGKSKVLLVEFKYKTPEIQKLVTKELSSKAIKDFYDKNKKLFMNKTKVIPFAKAKSKARSILASRYAKKFAVEKASKFAETAYEIGDIEEENQRKAFDDLLVEFKYKAVQTDWIKDNAEKVGAINEPALVKEISIFREVPVSNHVIGKNAAYVAFIIEKIMPRPALFEEIKTKIVIRLKEQKALQMARSQARELVAKLQKMSRAERMKAITVSKDPKFKSLKAFSLKNSSRARYAYAISGMVNEISNGEVAPAQQSIDGAIVAVLRKRVLPGMKAFAKEQKILTSIYKREKVSAAQGGFSAWLQTKCMRFKKQ